MRVRFRSWKLDYDPLPQLRASPRAVHTLSHSLLSPPQLAVLGHLLSLMRPSSLRQYLGAETLPPSQGKQPRASAELDYKVSTSTPCLPLPRRTLLLHLTGKAGLSPLHSLWGLWSLVLREPEATPGQRPASYLLCGEEALSISPKPLVSPLAHLCL